MERDFQSSDQSEPVARCSAERRTCRSAFIDTWTRALGAYGTPADFVSSVRYVESSFSMQGVEYPLVIAHGGNYHKRVQLMATQRRYEPAHPAASYPPDVRPDGCFLCQNIQQALDAARDPARCSNVMFDLGSHYVLPNRYPAHLGSSLFVPKGHDDHERRVDIHARRLEDGFGIRTFGNLLGWSDLLTLFHFADANELIAARNHVLDGMSIPCHDHFHLHSAALPSSKFFCGLVAAELSCNGPVERFPTATPFATLLLVDPDRAQLARRAAEIFGRLEFAHVVYTVAYWGGGVAISPRRCDTTAERIPKVGGDVPLHSFDVTDLETWALVQRHVPLRGEFDWRPYLERGA